MDLSREFNRQVVQTWHQFIDKIESLRPILHRYCLSLTGSVWDAEDLVQETLLRAFAKLGGTHHTIENPKAYLFRMASHLWIDQVRRGRPVALSEDTPTTTPQARAEVRDAAAKLVGCLPPQERAAVLLKDVCEFSISEIASVLQTSEGAVKAALHRGREKLDEGRIISMTHRPSEALLDEFVEAFNARDIDRLTSLLRADAAAEVVGVVNEYGREAIRDGSLHHTLFDEAGESRAERTAVLGEPVVMLRYMVDGSRVMRDVLRFEDVEGKIARLRYYYFCPETLNAVAATLGVPVATNSYRYP